MTNGLRRAGWVTVIALPLAIMVLIGNRPHFAPLPVRTPAVMAQVKIRNRDIALFEERARTDPYSAADRSRLASLFLQRARETGDYEDFRRAEKVARESVRLRTERNAGGMLMLSSSLLAQHRFAEAREVAERLVAIDPDKPSFRSLLAEIQLELGDYTAADASFRSLRMDRYNLAVAPRYAHWLELTGASREAQQILYASLEQAIGRSDLPREQIAWYYLRVADFEARFGRLDKAESAARDGLTLEPADHRLWSMLARIAATRRDWKRVVEYGERAGSRADFATLALIGDAHQAMRESDKAEAYYQRIEAGAVENPEPFARQWTMFRLNHGRELAATLEILERENKLRPDVLGWDMYAWALYKNGRFAEARAAYPHALANGTEEATFYFHAAMIEKALGNPKAEAAHLRRARDLNRHVDRLFSQGSR